jgi:hypothetical protein
MYLTADVVNRLQAARRQASALPEKRPLIGRDRAVRQHSSKGSDASLSRTTSYQRVPSAELLNMAAEPSQQNSQPVVIVDPGGAQD